MISLLVGLGLITLGAMLMWIAVIQLGGWIFVGLALGDQYKGSNASFKFPWYFNFLPVPLVMAGVVVLVLR